MEENYLMIKNDEIEVGEKSGILVIDFSKDTKELISSFKIEQKEIAKRKNETNDKYILKLDSLNESHKEHLDSFQKKKDEIEANYEKELVTIEALRSSEKAALEKSIEDIKKDYLDKTESLQKEYEINVAKSNDEIEKINTLFEAEKAVLEDQLSKIQAEHDEKMAVLNSDINAKIEKLKEESNKNIDESKAALLIAEEEYTKEFEDSKFEYDYSVQTMDRNHSIEQEEYDMVTAEIKSTLESKIARHEKFMNKSMENNDTRAVKQHKKEILMLQKNAEKRLKDLALEHENNIKEYEIKKKQSLKEHLEEASKLNIKITQFRDAEEFKIKNFEAKIENDLECIEFRIKSKIQEEIHTFNEAEKDHAIKVAACISKHEIDLEKELENQSERDVITQLLSQGHKIDFTKINYAILTQGLDWTLNIVQKWIFDLLLSFHTQQSHYFKGQEAQIFSQTKQLNLNTLLLFASELNELKKIASHPVNQELQLQNIFVKYKQIFEPS